MNEAKIFFIFQDMKLYYRTSYWAKKESLEYEIKKSTQKPLHKPSTWNYLTKIISHEVEEGY